MSKTREPQVPWYESNLFWGPVGIVLVVLASVMRDLKFLLIPAGVCLLFFVWFVSKRRWHGIGRWVATGVGALVVCAGLVCLYRTKADAVEQKSAGNDASAVKQPTPSSPEQNRTPAEQPKIKTRDTSKRAVPSRKAPSQPQVIVKESPGSAVSIGQQGGITAGTINMGVPPRVVQVEIDQLQAILGKVTIPISFGAVVNASDGFRYAGSLQEAFRKAGAKEVGKVVMPLAPSGADPSGVQVVCHCDYILNKGSFVYLRPDSPEYLVAQALRLARVEGLSVRNDSSIPENLILVNVFSNPAEMAPK